MLASGIYAEIYQRHDNKNSPSISRLNPTYGFLKINLRASRRLHISEKSNGALGRISRFLEKQRVSLANSDFGRLIESMG